MLLVRHVILGLLTVAVLAEADQKGLHFHQARFLYHSKNDFERFVLEFTGKRSQTPEPEIGLQPMGQEFAVEVKKIPLLEDIPEKELTKAFLAQSRYLGEVKALRRNDRISLNISLKKSSAAIEVFWLNSPPRLVFDVFGDANRVVSNVVKKVSSVALAASTPPIESKEVETNSPAKEPGTAVNQLAESTVTQETKSKLATSEGESNPLACFPIEVGRVYHPESSESGKSDDKEKVAPHASETALANNGEPLSTGVVCFPKSAALDANQFVK